MSVLEFIQRPEIRQKIKTAPVVTAESSNMILIVGGQSKAVELINYGSLGEESIYRIDVEDDADMEAVELAVAEIRS